MLRYSRWHVYLERGQPRQPVGVWLYSERLAVVHEDEPMAEYRVAHQPDNRRLKSVTKEPRFETPPRSLPPPLWAWRRCGCLVAPPLPPCARQRSRPAPAIRPPLFTWEGVG